MISLHDLISEKVDKVASRWLGYLLNEVKIILNELTSQETHPQLVE